MVMTLFSNVYSNHFPSSCCAAKWSKWILTHELRMRPYRNRHQAPHTDTHTVTISWKVFFGKPATPFSRSMLSHFFSSTSSALFYDDFVIVRTNVRCFDENECFRVCAFLAKPCRNANKSCCWWLVGWLVGWQSANVVMGWELKS